MRTLFVSYRVTDLERSLRFCTALGYGVLGRVEAGDGSRLVILKFPEETAASLELVHRPADGPVDVGSGVDHLAVQVEGMARSLEAVAGGRSGSGARPESGGSRGPEDLVAHGPGRVPDRTGGVAGRTPRRDDRGGLLLSGGPRAPAPPASAGGRRGRGRR